MKTLIAFRAILKKDMRTYYLKPPNLSWGIIFPLAWTLMFFIKFGSGFGDIRTILPGVMALSILFGTTSMLAKTSGAIIMGTLNAFVPVFMASFFVDLGGVIWWQTACAVVFIAISSIFLGLFIAVFVSEVFEAQTFSNFFRFPMVFLCGLFFSVSAIPFFLRPLSYALPLTYGADLLHGALNRTAQLSVGTDLLVLAGFCIVLFLVSLRNIRRRWIT